MNLRVRKKKSRRVSSQLRLDEKKVFSVFSEKFNVQQTIQPSNVSNNSVQPAVAAYVNHTHLTCMVRKGRPTVSQIDHAFYYIWILRDYPQQLSNEKSSMARVYVAADNHRHKYSFYNCKFSHWNKYSFCWLARRTSCRLLRQQAVTIEMFAILRSDVSVYIRCLQSQNRIRLIWYISLFRQCKHFVSFRSAQMNGNMASVCSHIQCRSEKKAFYCQRFANVSVFVSSLDCWLFAVLLYFSSSSHSRRFQVTYAYHMNDCW